MSTSIATFAPRARFSLPVLGASSGSDAVCRPRTPARGGGDRSSHQPAPGGALSPRRGAGLVLYHAAFGFTSAWRVFIADRRGAGLRAQMLMLAVAMALFFPVLAAGSLFGQPVQRIVAPIGVSVVFGAFIFGLGMQLGGGCASGTLYTVGGGSTRMLMTLAFFIVGSTLGAAHIHWWTDLPTLPKTSLVKLWGPWTALALSLVAVRRDRGRDRRAGAAAARVARRRQADAALRVRALRPRSLAARCRRGRARDRQLRDPRPFRAALGHHLGLRALGLEDRRRHRNRGLELALLVDAGASRRVRGQRLQRRHLGDGFRHHRRRAPRRRARRALRPGLAHSAGARPPRR